MTHGSLSGTNYHLDTRVKRIERIQQTTTIPPTQIAIATPTQTTIPKSSIVEKFKKFNNKSKFAKVKIFNCQLSSTTLSCSSKYSTLPASLSFQLSSTSSSSSPTSCSFSSLSSLSTMSMRSKSEVELQNAYHLQKSTNMIFDTIATTATTSYSCASTLFTPSLNTRSKTPSLATATAPHFVKPIQVCHMQRLAENFTITLTSIKSVLVMLSTLLLLLELTPSGK